MRARPSSHECLTTQPHHRVEASFRSERREPGVDTAAFTGYAHEPACKRRHCAEQQVHFDARTFAREAVFETLSVAMGFQVVERQLDLHAPPVQRDQLSRAEVQRRGGHQQPRLAFALCVFAAVGIACWRALPIAVLASFGRLGMQHHTRRQWLAARYFHGTKVAWHRRRQAVHGFARHPLIRLIWHVDGHPPLGTKPNGNWPSSSERASHGLTDHQPAHTQNF